MLQLRPHQKKAEALIKSAFQSGKKSVLLVMPTGGGKTESACSVIISALSKKNPCWFVAPRLALINQTHDRLAGYGISAGIIQQRHRLTDYRKLMQVCSIDTVMSRISSVVHKPKIIIVDEAHEGAFGKNMSLLRETYPDAFYIFMTATPWRLDGKGLGRFCDEMIEPTSVAELMDDKFLVPYKLFRGAEPDTTGLRKVGGDWDISELAEKSDTFELNGQLVQNYQSFGQGKPALCFAVNIEHSKHIAQRFTDSGIPFDHVDSYQNSKALAQSIERMKSGQIVGISSVGKLTTGFDYPAAKVAIIARKTESLSLHLQMIGRVLRPEFKIARPGEYAIMLDHAGNFRKHGHAFDEQPWMLVDRPKREYEDMRPTYQCPQCTEEFKTLPKCCPSCGFEFKSGGIAQEYMLPVETEDTLVEDSSSEFTLFRRKTYRDLLHSAVCYNQRPEQMSMIFNRITSDYRFANTVEENMSGYPTKEDMKGASIHIKKIDGTRRYVDPTTKLPIASIDNRELLSKGASPRKLSLLLSSCKNELEAGARMKDVLSRAEIYLGCICSEEQIKLDLLSLINRKCFNYDFEKYMEQGSFL
jgi:DNA repair protein RadD